MKARRAKSRKQSRRRRRAVRPAPAPAAPIQDAGPTAEVTGPWPAPVAATAELDQTRAALEKRQLRGAAALSRREIGLIQRYEDRKAEDQIRQVLSAVPQHMFCELLDVQRKVLLDWEAEGVFSRTGAGRHVLYNMFVSLPKLRRRWSDDARAGGGEGTTEHTRWQAARATMAEMDLAKARGELISRADVERERLERIREVKGALLPLARRLAPILAALDGNRKSIEDRIASEVSKILQTFAGVAP